MEAATSERDNLQTSRRERPDMREELRRRSVAVATISGSPIRAYAWQTEDWRTGHSRPIGGT